jgi:flagellin
MAIRINENIFSLLVNRNLDRSSRELENSFRRLSTGERVTKAMDDPSGLANSNLLRAKITGLQRNLRNCNEGVSILSVAESSLGNVTDIIQRIRELAIQASNATMNDGQRQLSQQEIDQLIDEIQRIAETANYNEKSLLDGTFQGMVIQVGTRQNETMPISIEDAQVNVLGAVANPIGANAVSNVPIAGTGDLRINLIDIPASEYDGVSTVDNTASAAAKAKAINLVTDDTGVEAVVIEATHSDTTANISAGSLDGTTSSLTINGVNIGPTSWEPGDSKNTLRERINGYVNLTGVEATLGADGQLVLTAVDGRNVEVVTTGSVADELGLQAANGDMNTVLYGSIQLISGDTIQVGGTPGLIGFAAGQATSFVDLSTAIENLRVTSFEDAQEAIRVCDIAQKQILRRRASLGALESRINKTINDLMINVENLSGADSRIRDADFAVETAALTQNQIIQQAGIAVLSQANVVPRMALELLQR